MSEHCLEIFRHIDIFSHYVDISRYLLTLSTHIYTLSRHTFLDTFTHCLHTSRYCPETLMIALDNGLERRKMIKSLYHGLESYVCM